MKPIELKIQTELTTQLKSDGLIVSELIPIPKNQDSSVRIRTVQEILSEFDDDLSEDEAMSYIIHIRKSSLKNENSPHFDPHPENNSTQTKSQDIYLEDGSLNAPYLFENAKLLISVNDFRSARNILKTLIQEGKDIAQAFFLLGQCDEHLGNTQEAIKNYEEAALYQPHLKYYYHLALLLKKENRLQQAVETLERSLSTPHLSDTQKFEINETISECAIKAGLHTSAELALKRALAIQPSSDSIIFKLGTLYLSQENMTQAHKAFTYALKLNSKNHQAYSGLAACEWAQGHFESAYQHWIDSLQLNIHNPQAIYYLVKSAYQLKKHQPACTLLQAYVDVSPFNGNLLYSLAGLYFHLNQLDSAQKIIQRILSIQPNHAEAKQLGQRIGMTF